MAELESKEQEWRGLINEGTVTLRAAMKDSKHRKWLAGREKMQDIDQREQQLQTSLSDESEGQWSRL